MLVELAAAAALPPLLQQQQQPQQQMRCVYTPAVDWGLLLLLFVC